MGFFDFDLIEENKQLFELYNKIIDPTNQSIDWQSYIMFCYLEDFKNWKDNQEIILHIRDTVSKYRDTRSNQKIESKSLNNSEKFEKIKKVDY
jgi:hypothetical protein